MHSGLIDSFDSFGAFNVVYGSISCLLFHLVCPSSCMIMDVYQLIFNPGVHDHA